MHLRQLLTEKPDKKIDIVPKQPEITRSLRITEKLKQQIARDLRTVILRKMKQTRHAKPLSVKDLTASAKHVDIKTEHLTGAAEHPEPEHAHTHAVLVAHVAERERISGQHAACVRLLNDQVDDGIVDQMKQTVTLGDVVRDKAGSGDIREFVRPEGKRFF